MGFFSNIISDAQRVSATAFRTGIEPGAEKADGSLFGDPGLDMNEAAPQHRVEELAAAPRTDASQGMANSGDTLQPPDMPGAGPNEKLAVAPDHGMVAKPVSVAPLATGGEPIGARIEPRHQEAHFEPEPAGLLRPALAEAPVAAQPFPAHGADAAPEPGAQDGGRRAEQERRRAAVRQRPEEADLQLVAPQSAEAGFAAINGVAVIHAATEARSLQDVAEEAPPARQEAMAAGFASRPAASAPVAIDLTPVRCPAPGHAAASNAGPQVHIGHIDIVVLAPEQARPQQPPVSASADVASRHYLRRL